jgi:hypothetical protein
LGKRITGADRGHHRARDDRSDAGHRHETLAALVLAGKRFDLIREPFKCVFARECNQEKKALLLSLFDTRN